VTWHLLTGELPPRCGGVGDYTANLAAALAAAGDRVRVHAPFVEPRREGNLSIEPLPDLFGRASQAALAAAVDAEPGIVLLQYVPNALGQRGMNLPFCGWLKRLRRAGADVRVMFHEPYFYFSWERPWRNLLALVQRRMAATLLDASACVYVSTETWRPFLSAVGTVPACSVLPIPSSLQAVATPAAVDRVRARYAPDARPLVGHFGTYGAHVATMLERWLPAIADAAPQANILCLGDGSDAFVTRTAAHHARLAGRLSATGRLEGAALAAALAACDVLVQPYPDGVTTRRTSVMAGLRLGVPTVSTTGPLTEPVWRETNALRLVPTDATAAAAQGVAALLDDPSARHALGEAGGAAYEARFSMERTIGTLRASGTAA
jgi:glycosyltransferase involved in cell wall biosynthesis